MKNEEITIIGLMLT